MAFVFQEFVFLRAEFELDLVWQMWVSDVAGCKHRSDQEEHGCVFQAEA